MGQKIYSYSIIIGISLLLLAHLPVSAQQRPYVPSVPKREQQKEVKSHQPDTIPLFNGISAGIDIYGLGRHLFGSDLLSTELDVVVNLKNRYLPTVEIGFGKTDACSDDGNQFKTSAPYFRIGADYNFLHKKKLPNCFAYAGFRYGFCKQTYDAGSLPAPDDIWGDQIENPSIQDDIWGGSLPYYYPKQKANTHWMELVGGVKVNIFKSFSMGWSVRLRYKIGGQHSDYGNPWYVPGYGKYDNNSFDINYSLIYELPF